MLCWLVYVVLVMRVACFYGQQDDGLTVEELHSRIKDLETTAKLLLRKLAQEQASNTESGTNLVPNVEKRGYIDVLYSGGEVGFHSTLYNAVSVDRGQNIPFEIDITNIGCAFDERSSQFTCLRSGTYIFALTIACERRSYVEAYLEIVSESRGKTYYLLNSVCDHRERTILGERLYCGYSQNGGTTVLSLQEGDVVAVKSDKSGKLAGSGLSTFSGYLLRSSD